MSDNLKIVALARTDRNVDRFLRVSYEIYREDPYWVAPLLMDLKKVFTDANPLFSHAEMGLWVALKNGRDVGRIAGIIDHNHNRIQKDSAAFFGFYEAVNDPEVSRRLFGEVYGWARQRQMRRVMGPMNPTTNDECGLLVEGFDSSPLLMMTYNPKYYIDQIEGEGFLKAKDLVAYHMEVPKCPLERLGRIAEKVRARYPELTFRTVKRKTLLSDLAKIKEIYNDAWQENWGFVPMTDNEVDFMAQRLKPLLQEGLVWLAETHQDPVAFMLAATDFNQPLKPLKGRLLTPKIFGFIPYLLGWKHPTACRVIILGVKERYRAKGLESVMLTEGFKTGIRLGLQTAEASWILEDNLMMRRLLEAFGGVVYKRYRIYQREL